MLRWPGMQLQRLTALQPTSDMLEVAIVSMKLAAQIPLTPEEERICGLGEDPEPDAADAAPEPGRRQ